MRHNVNITDDDIAMARKVRTALLAVMALPIGPLEHLVQQAHASSDNQRRNPREIFAKQGVKRQPLRMLWHFRCNIDDVWPKEDRG